MIDYQPSQTVASQFPEIPHDEFDRSVQLIEPDGRVSSGAAAVFRALSLAGHGALWRLYQSIPGFGRSAEAIYGFVSRHRPQLDRLERLVTTIGDDETNTA